MAATLATGVDLIDISRFKGVFSRYGQRLLDHVFLPSELAYCRGRVPELAVRFAAKEAVSKALGTGLRGVSFREIEIVGDELGKPLVRLYGRARQRADDLGLTQFEVSLSHERTLGIAFVVAQGVQNLGDQSPS